MANIFTKIQRKVNRGEIRFSRHSAFELDDEGFTQADAVKVILKPFNYYEFTHDKSHVRFCFEGYTNDDRMLAVIAFLDKGIVRVKTAYEIFD